MEEWLSRNAWLDHYEVVVRRQGRDQLVARVATRREAELAIRSISRTVEISRTAVSMRRARGVHPANAAKACLLLMVVALLLPWFWLQLIVCTVATALLCGLLSSGSSWRQGGDDDR